MRSLSRKVMDLGAGGMIAPARALILTTRSPPISAMPSEAIGSDIPWVFKDYPQFLRHYHVERLGQRVVTEIRSLVVLKHEDWPGVDKITTLRGWEKDGSMRKISISNT